MCHGLETIGSQGAKVCNFRPYLKIHIKCYQYVGDKIKDTTKKQQQNNPPTWSWVAQFARLEVCIANHFRYV